MNTKIIGIGTDLVEKRRIENLVKRFGDRFIARILSEEEKNIYYQKQSRDYLAKRFAAKEAVAKALGTGIGEKVAFHDISITNHSSGQPSVTLQGKAKKLYEALSIGAIHISLSDEKEFAMAFAVVEKA